MPIRSAATMLVACTVALFASLLSHSVGVSSDEWRLMSFLNRMHRYDYLDRLGDYTRHANTIQSFSGDPLKHWDGVPGGLTLLPESKLAMKEMLLWRGLEMLDQRLACEKAGGVTSFHTCAVRYPIPINI